MRYELKTNKDLRTEEVSIITILLNRQIQECDIYHYLNTTDEDVLNPLLLDNMEKGAKLLISHISNNDNILVQIDGDCDGYTSAAVLINYLNILFPHYVNNHIKYRVHSGKEHGLIYDTIPEDISLVIAPDSSSNDYEVHRRLAERGVDVLVIDHHEAEKISENAVVINNQLCDYPTKSLSGVAMVYKFCQYIDSLLKVDYANQFLDLVALGLIADMMDLRDFETRHLVTKGLLNIQNSFMEKMVNINAYSLGEEITPIGIAFYIAPGVNATVRSGTDAEKLLLFEAMLEHKAKTLIPSTKRGCTGQKETLVEQVCRNCTNIKNRQKIARDKGLEIIEDLIEKNQLLDNKILIVPLDQNNSINKNLTGLIANVLMAKYQRPVLILNKRVKDDIITWEGSARGYEKSEVKNFREFIMNSGLALYQDGHSNAFGTGFTTENLLEFIKYSNEKLINCDFSPIYSVDFIFNEKDTQFNFDNILSIADYKYLWGQGVEEPLIAIENIYISKDDIVLMSPDKKPTLKIKLPNGIDLIKFGSSKEEFETLNPKEGQIVLNIVGRCEKNVFRGLVSPQIIIEAYEIVGRKEYYF